MTLQPLSIALDFTRPFALIEKAGVVGAYQGRVFQIDRLIDIHLLSKKEMCDIVFVLPYRSIQERGCEANGTEPILAMTVDRCFKIGREEFKKNLPIEPVILEGEVSASLSDDEFADMVRRFQGEAIEKGLCSQTTLSRRFSGKISDFSLPKILSLYRQLLAQPGHYMTVLFADIHPTEPKQNRFIIAGTPERHLEISGNETIMCPIAGTCRKEDQGTFPARLESFLRDPKEVNELFQVLDEEMKMMGAICPKGGTIHGPYLHEVGAVVHTEYMLIGRRSTHAIDALRNTLHAPTVVGSPLISAARLIAQYEPHSRRYYAGEIGLYHQSRTDLPDGDLDSAILIRGAEISGDGQFHIQAGAGIVRDSDPVSEARETRAKAMGILRVITGETGNARFLTEELRAKYRALLESRNDALSSFWQSDQGDGVLNIIKAFKDKSVVIVNNEDDFAFMLAHMMHGLGVEDIQIVDTFAFDPKQECDMVLLGPGPGDPTDMKSPRMRKLQDIIARLKEMKRPMLGICLGHQALAVSEGLPVTQQRSSTQGMPRRVVVDGEECQLGFYNSFSPVLPDGQLITGPLEADPDENGRIIAMRGEMMIGYQFHPESVMSIDGRKLMLQALKGLLT